MTLFQENSLDSFQKNRKLATGAVNQHIKFIDTTPFTVTIKILAELRSAAIIAYMSNLVYVVVESREELLE